MRLNKNNIQMSSLNKNKEQGHVQVSISKLNKLKASLPIDVSRRKGTFTSLDKGSGQGQTTWSQIIEQVEDANRKQIQKIRWRSRDRMIAYKGELDMQVEQHRRGELELRQNKSKQRKQIQQLTKEQKKKEEQKKRWKIKTQQKYQQQNLQLHIQKLKTSHELNPQQQLTQQQHMSIPTQIQIQINTNTNTNKNTNTKNQIKYKKNTKGNRKQVLQKYKEHPFVKLVDQQDQRLRQTKANFMLQNQLNSVQIGIKSRQEQERLRMERQARLQYDRYVEQQYQAQEQNRNKFKTKYLSIKKWQYNPQSQVQADQSVVNNIERSYIKFLDDQVEWKKRIKKDILSKEENKINQHIDIADSSPAYLGRIPYEHDRKKQLDMVDRKIYGGSMLGSRYQSVDLGNRDDHNSSTLTEKRPKSTIQMLPQLKKPGKQTKQSNNKNKSISVQNSMIKLPQNKEQHERGNRKYLCYNVITGNKQTIVI